MGIKKIGFINKTIVPNIYKKILVGGSGLTKSLSHPHRYYWREGYLLGVKTIDYNRTTRYIVEDDIAVHPWVIGYIDQHGKEVIPLIYEDLRFGKQYQILKVERAALAEENKEWDGDWSKWDGDSHDPYFQSFDSAAYYVDIEKTEFICHAYEDALCTPSKSFIPVKLNGKVGILNSKRETVVPIEYDSMLYCKTTKMNRDFLLGYKDKKVNKLNCKGKLLDVYDSIVFDERIFWIPDTYGGVRRYASVYVWKDGKMFELDEWGNIKTTKKDNHKTDNNSIAIDWTSFKNTSFTKEYSFGIAIKSDVQLKNVKVFLNGALHRSLSTIPDDGYSFRKDYSVSLKEGKNTIRVEATNAIGTVKDEKVVTYTKSQAKVTNEKRIALVMGNNNYGNGNNLNNSINDARAVAAKLKALGFTVVTAFDQNKQQMENTISDFSEKAKGYDVAMFYYAGHGMAIDHKNYLIPVGTNMNDEKVAKYNSIEVQMALDMLNASGCSLKMLFLDACRDNPFAKRSTSSNGFGSMDAAEGTIIFFSTAIDSKASDGTVAVGHSPFASAFLRTLDIPNLSEDDFLKEVTTQVKTATSGSQFPFRTSAFTGSFIFNRK